MKKTTIAAVSIIAITAIAILFHSCKKSGVEFGGNKNLFPDLVPVSVPTFTTNEEVNDQLRSLAYGLASITDTMFLVADNPTLYKNDVESLIPSGRDEVSFDKLRNSVNTSTTGNYQTRTFGYFSDFERLIYEAITWQSPLYYTTTPRSWGASTYNFFGYGGFQYNSSNFYTLVRIPDWENLQNNSGRLSKTFLVVPNERDTNDNVLLPIVGYKMDFTTLEIDTVLFQTEEEFEDDSTHYIWVVDCERVGPVSGGGNSNCTGENAPKPNDGYCDLDCGEDSITSFNDCGSSFMRRVWIEEVEISEDYKQKCGTNYQWWESRFMGKYEIAYHSLVVHANGKVKHKGGLFDHFWSRSNVYKTKKLGPGCNFKTKGTAENIVLPTLYRWWYGDNPKDIRYEEENQSLQPIALISNSFKPWRDTIFLVFYEWDEGARRRNNHEFDVWYRAGKKEKIHYNCLENEGPFGDKNNASSPESYNAIPPNGKVIMITPTMWPGNGLMGVASDMLVFSPIMSSGGSNANTRSIKVKVKYGF